jgi:beta-glucanase (GH16 family)
MFKKISYRSHMAVAAGSCAVSLWVASAQAAPPVPKINETFLPWSSTYSPDGLFRINGNWIGTGGNELMTTDAQEISGGKGDGQLLLLVPGAQTATPYHAAEMQSLAGSGGKYGTVGYGYGYYETLMKVTKIGNSATNTGVCASFFWISAPTYGPDEIDVEINTRESWITSADTGIVHFTLHPVSNPAQSIPVSVPFNPSRAFHRYGFLWTPGQVVFTVDGKPLLTLKDSTFTAPANGGYIMANEWTGNPNWSGEPPAYNATTAYLWMKFWPGVTTIPDPAG